MADGSAANTEKKPKRKLRAAPTLREQATMQAAKTEKPSRFRRARSRVAKSRVFTPFKALGRGIKKVVYSRPMKPVRFVGRIISKILFLSYFKNSWLELRLVTWPTNRTTWRLTGAVLVFAIAFGIFIAGLDFVLERGFREVLLK